MAKRNTIRVNPLDTLVPDPVPRRTGELPAAAKAQSAGPAAVNDQTAVSRKQPRAKNSTAPASAMQVAQPPPPADLFSRIQSLEEQNEYIKWLLGGALLLAVLL